MRRRRLGFTLLELLISIAVIGILAAIVIVAINPEKQLGDANDTKRLADVDALLKAVNQFQIDRWRLPQFNGADSVVLQSAPQSKEICALDSSNPSFGFCDIFGFRYLGELAPTFISKMPIDPDHDPADTWGTDYLIWKDEDGRITVSAPLYNDGEGIERKL